MAGLQIAGDTVPTTTGAAATANIPFCSDGTTLPMSLLVTAQAACFVKPFSSTQSAPADSALVHLPANVGIVLNVAGCNRMRHLQLTAPTTFYMTPLAGT